MAENPNNESATDANRFLDIRFDLQTPRDLLAKLHREFERFDAGPTADHLFNFVVTAHSLTDWIETTWVEVLEVESEQRKRALDALRDQSAIRVCRDISNGSKHFHVDRENRANQLHPPLVTEAKVYRGFGRGRFGRGPFGRGEPSYQVAVDGQELDMLKVTRDTIELFDAFFETHAL